MAAFRSGQDAFHSGELFCRRKYRGLLHAAGGHITVMIQLGEDGAHAVIAQAARMVGRRDEVAAQGVHLCQRADHSGVTEIIHIFAAGQARAGSGLHRDDLIVSFPSEHLAHKRGDQAAQIGTAARAADDHVGNDAVLIHGCLSFQADHGLVQKHLGKHAAQHVTVALLACGRFHRFGNGAAQTAAGSGMLCKDLSSHRRGIGGRRRHLRPIGTHHLTAERLLFIGNLYHIYLAVQAKIGAGHGKGGSPLSGSGFRCHTLQALLFRIIGLSDGRIELVASAGIIALKFIVNLGRGLQLFLQTVSPDQRRRTVHLVEFLNLLRDIHIGGGVVQLLLHQLVAEHAAQVVKRHGL